MSSDFWQDLIDIITEDLLSIKQCIESFLPDIPKTANDSIKSFSSEKWELYHKTFYIFLDKFHDITSNCLLKLIPLRFLIESYHNDTLKTPLPNWKSRYFFNNKNESLVGILKTLLISSVSIRSNLEKYFMLSFLNIPGWKILPNIFDSVENQANLDLPDSDDTEPPQIDFFMEMCKVRCLTHIIDITHDYVLIQEQNPSNQISGAAMIKSLVALNLLPGNFRYLRLHNIDKPLQEFLTKKTFRHAVMMYTQTQVDLSFKHAFLNLNLISYQENTENYLQFLLDRNCWFFIGPMPRNVLDMEHLSTSIILSENKQELQFFETEDYNDYFSFVANVLPECDYKNYKTPNNDFIYKTILRYMAIIKKLCVKYYLDCKEIVRVEHLDADVSKLSKLLSEAINEKFGNIYQKIKSKIHKKHQDLLYPPSDKEWVKYKHKLEYINESSIIEILYSELKNIIIATVNKDIKQIFFHPSPTEASLFEYMVLEIVNLLIGQKFEFQTELICFENELFSKIIFLQKERRMPMLLQSFNRMVFYKKGCIKEFKNIFDCLAFLIQDLIINFPSEKLTLFCIRFVEDLERQLINMRKQKELDSLSSTATVNMTSPQTTMAGFNTDPNAAAHKSIEYMEEVKQQEAQSFLVPT